MEAKNVLPVTVYLRPGMSSFIMIQTLHHLAQITRFPKVKEDIKVIKEVFTTNNE